MSKTSAKTQAKRAAAPAGSPMKIRIGTLVNGGGDAKPGDYIRQMLPHGFESFSVTFWQTLGGADLKRIAADVRESLAGSDAVISSLGIFGNPLKGDALARQNIAGWAKCIDAAHLFGCDLVTGFAGRVEDKPIEDSMNAFAKVFGPLTRRAADRGVRLAFENCDMGGDWWRGGWNIAQNPTAWEMMFNAVPMDNLGLQWEPCHQMVSLIDPLPQLAKWVKKVFCLHGKDATIRWDVIREFGVHGPKQFAWHRSPGFGDTNWTDLITILRQGGFEGAIDIEGWHDPVYRGELETTGQVHALNYLKRCRGGDFVPNPK
jgi:sugar phosphate isomerase/epimerase